MTSIWAPMIKPVFNFPTGTMYMYCILQITDNKQLNTQMDHPQQERQYLLLQTHSVFHLIRNKNTVTFSDTLLRHISFSELAKKNDSPEFVSTISRSANIISLP